jgi:hypothetical protein
MKNLTGKSSIITLSNARLAATEDGDTSEDWKGVRFRKQIASFGDWVDPNDPSKTMTLDDAFADEMIANFEAMRDGTKLQLPRVAIPMNHTDDSWANAGEVVALEKDAAGIWATMEIRDWGVQFKIEDDLVWDVSMAFDFDYEDTKGERHGVVLEHVALVNNPYLFGMSEFERAPEQKEKDAAIKAYWDDMDDWYGEFKKENSGSAIMLSKSKAKELSAMSKRKKQLEKESKVTLATVTNDREFDVTITVKDEDGEDVEQIVKAGETVEVPDDQEEDVKKQIADAEAPTDEDLSDDDDKDGEGDDDKDGEGDDADKDKKDTTPNPDRDNKTLSKKERAELADLRAKEADRAAEAAYQTLLSGGFIVPAQKDAFIQLHKAGGSAKIKLSRDKKEVELSTSDAIIDLVKAGGKRVDFSQNGSGKTTTDDNEAAVSTKLSEEQTEGLKANGISQKQVDDLAAKSPLYAEQMAKLTKKDK